MLPEADQVRLRHMLEATREALGYAQGRSRADLERDGMLFRAIVKCIEIVGEAAARIGVETKRQLPSIPWVTLKGMRNRLIHGYFDIDRDTVWGTVTTDLPALEQELAKVLEEP